MIDISSYINPTLAIILWGIGILIKHSKIFNKISNNNIPLILAILGIIINLIMNGNSLDSILAGFVTSMVCVGVHKSGQETFGVNGLNLSSMFADESDIGDEIQDEEIELEDQSD